MLLKNKLNETNNEKATYINKNENKTIVFLEAFFNLKVLIKMVLKRIKNLFFISKF